MREKEIWTTKNIGKTHKHRERWSKFTQGHQDKQIWERHVNKSFGQGIWHHTQWIMNNTHIIPNKTSHWHIRIAAHRHGFHMIVRQYFQPTFIWKLSQPASWNLQPYPQLGPPKNISFKKAPYPTRSRPAEIYTERVGDLFPKKKTRSLETSLQRLKCRKWVKWSSDCLWDPNSKKSQQKQLVTGTCFFSANFGRTNSIKASFAPTSLQSCKFMHNCLLAPDAPSGNRAEGMWSFQMLDTEVRQRAHPEGYSSSFGSSRFHE